MTYANVLEALLSKTDDVYNQWELESANLKASANATVTCAKGCGACCHFPTIPVTMGEAFVLFNHLLASGFSLTTLHGQFLSYSEKYFLAAKKLGALPFDEQRIVEFMKMRLPCPLFQKSTAKIDDFGGSCSAFSVRPLICDYFHSTDSPSLCAAHKPHGTISRVINRGVAAVDELREFERTLFGWSVLGHLPLLLAAFCTQQGLELFMTRRLQRQDEEQQQAIAEFQIYSEFLEILGYRMGENDLISLELAQSEIKKN